MQVNSSPGPKSGSSANSSMAAADVSSPTIAPQTLSDLKKQRSMHRVAQQNSPQAQGRNSERGSHSQSQHKSKEDQEHHHQRHRRDGSSKRSSKNGRDPRGQQSRGHSSSRKKFAATEVVGPSPKKVGCCRVM